MPRSEITPAIADLLKAHVGEQVTVHWPGEPIEDDDGTLRMTEPRTILGPSWPASTSRRIPMTTESIDDRQDARNEEIPQNAHQPEDANSEEVPQNSPEDTESEDAESPNAVAARYREKLREAEATVTTLTLRNRCPTACWGRGSNPPGFSPTANPIRLPVEC